MLNYSLKYRRFDQLLDEVMLDFQNYSLENMIEPHNMIKIAKQCNYNLGLRINMTKEAILEVEKGRVRLPYDFFTFNYGLLCGEHSVVSTLPQGTQTWEEPFPRLTDFNHQVDLCSDGTICFSCTKPKMSCSCHHETAPATVPPFNPLVPYGDYCVKPRVFMNCKGNAFELIQIVNTEVRTYRHLIPLKLSANSQNAEQECPNFRIKAKDEVWIKDGWLYSNFHHGRVFVCYQGMLQDEDGNLLVLDHDGINPYYEYAMKKRILENLWINGEDVAQKIQYMDQQFEKAKINAMSIAKMPNFEELKGYWKANRNAMYSKYYDMFASFQNDIWVYGYYDYNNYPNFIR